MGSSQKERARLPVLRPRLPEAERILPYLRSIDATRVYSNYGPLSSALATRLCQTLGIPDESAICTSSGTAALVGSILATAGRASAARPLAMIPAFTFVATAAAVHQCGYEPYLLDVATDSWMLDPSELATHPMLSKVGVVVPVAPFGRRFTQLGWHAFTAATGIPVVIDAAANFDTALSAPRDHLGAIPTVFSFHATKSFGTGEGGAVICTNATIVRDVNRCVNFGFYGMRDSQSASTNGKMSEYHAAVGLAELDGWPDKSSQWSKVAGLYREAMEAVQLSPYLAAYPDVSGCYALLICRTARQAEAAEAELDRADIDCRRWYGAGVHRQEFFRDAARDHLETTDAVLPRLIGLPVAPDLTAEDVERVVTSLRPVLSS